MTTMTISFVKYPGDDTMQMSQRIQSTMLLGLIAMAALVLVLFPGQAYAAKGGGGGGGPGGGGGSGSFNCAAALATVDTDGDGLTDTEECGAGLTLPGGLNFPTFTGGDRQDSVDPVTPDAFVIIIRADDSPLLTAGEGLAIPDTPEGNLTLLDFCRQPQSDGGLGVTIHVVTDAQAPLRVVVDRGGGNKQRAVRIVEFTTPSPTFGECQYGGPNFNANGQWFSQAIKDYVNGKSNDGNDHIADWVRYNKHTVSHEVCGHCWSLAVKDRYGGHHHRGGSGVMMEQQVDYDIVGGIAVFDISEDFTKEDKANFCLTKTDTSSDPRVCLPFEGAPP